MLSRHVKSFLKGLNLLLHSRLVFEQLQLHDFDFGMIFDPANVSSRQVLGPA